MGTRRRGRDECTWTKNRKKGKRYENWTEWIREKKKDWGYVTEKKKGWAMKTRRRDESMTTELDWTKKKKKGWGYVDKKKKKKKKG